MGITADIFKDNSLPGLSISPASLAKRPYDPYVYEAMAFSQMKRNC